MIPQMRIFPNQFINFFNSFIWERESGIRISCTIHNQLQFTYCFFEHLSQRFIQNFLVSFHFDMFFNAKLWIFWLDLFNFVRLFLCHLLQDNQIQNYLYNVNSTLLFIQNKKMQVRKRIFENWPVINKKHEVEQIINRKKNKNKQSLRAQQCLQKSLSLLVNITKTLQMKDHYKQQQQLCYIKLNQLYDKIQQQSNLANDQMQETLKSKNNSFVIKKQLYKQIRRNEQLLEEMKAFSLINLANFDKKTSKMQFTRTREQARNTLINFKNTLIQKRLKLQETLVAYQYEMGDSKILGETQTFEFCLRQLSQSINEENTIIMHSLMMYEIRQIDDMKNSQYEIVRKGKQIYDNYEAIDDSMFLMENHIDKMKKDEYYLKNFFKDLNNQKSEIIGKGYQNLGVLQKNMQIYISNKDNFIRLGAQTQMKKYQTLRKHYTNQLNSYTKTFKIWKDKIQIANFIYQKQIDLKNFNKKIAIGLSNLDKQQITHSYYSCLGKQVPNNMEQIKKYKYSVCHEMEQSINQNGISITLRKQGLSLPNEDILRKYSQFFMSLQYKTDKQKSEYILQNQQLIGIFIYQIQQQQSKEKQFQTDYQLLKYQIGLYYAQKIAQIQKSIQNKAISLIKIIEYLKEFDQLRIKRWKSLPIGLDNLLFKYINNLTIYLQANEYFQLNKNHSKEFQLQLKTNLLNQPNNGIQRQNNQIVYSLIKFDCQNYENIHKQVINQISEHSYQLKNAIQQQYWMQWQNSIINAYKEYFVGANFELGSMDKKEFFSFKVLSYLLISDRKFKLPNIELMCSFLMDYIDRGYYQWNTTRKYLQIIKIKMFEDYLKSIQQRQSQIYRQICINITKFLRLIFQSEIFLDRVNNQEMFSYGLKLNMRLSELTGLSMKTQKIQLQEKLAYLIKRIKILPIIVGTKKNPQQFYTIFDIQPIVTKYRVFKPTKYKLGIQNISYIFDINNDLIKQQILVNNKYQSYQNITIKDRSQIICHLKEFCKKLKIIVNQLNPLLIQVDRVFKDQHTKNEIGKIQIKTENQRFIEQVIIYLIKN